MCCVFRDVILFFMGASRYENGESGKERGEREGCRTSTGGRRNALIYFTRTEQLLLTVPTGTSLKVFFFLSISNSGRERERVAERFPRCACMQIDMTYFTPSYGWTRTLAGAVFKGLRL